MTNTDEERVRAVAAELRAMELYRALRNAVNGTPHWRLEAQNLLALVHYGVLPPRPVPAPQSSQEAA